MNDLPPEAARRRAVAWATALTADTPLAPQAYEAALLERYAAGALSLDQVLARLDVRVHHVLYRSQAAHPFTDGQLTDLLEQSRAWNVAHDVTGPLVYSADGHFVQVLEGDVLAVHALFDRIRRDPRHRHVTILSNAAGEVRHFADWRMAFARAAPAEFHWLLDRLEARRQRLVLPRVPIDDPLLCTLLEAFGKT